MVLQRRGQSQDRLCLLERELIADLTQRSSFDAGEGDGCRSAVDLTDGDREGSPDPSPAQGESLQPTMFQSRAQGERGGPGRRSPQAKPVQQATPGGQAEGVPVEDEDVHVAVRGLPAVKPRAVLVAVDEFEGA